MQQSLLPPRLFQICVIVLMAIDVFFGARPIFGGSLMLAIGSICILSGTGLTIAGADQFARHKTNINAFLMPNHLVTDGFYRFSRNPMYLGFVVILLGISAVLANWLGVVIALGFGIIADRWYIQFEEKALAETFGEAYRVYCRRTRRWL